MARYLTFPAGKRSKFVVADRLLPRHGGRRRAVLGQVRGRAGERDRLLPPRQGRVGQVARGRQAVPGRRARARGHRLRAQGRADRAPTASGWPRISSRSSTTGRRSRCRRRSRCSRRTATPRCSRSRSARPGTRHKFESGDGRDPRPRERRGRRADRQGHRRRRLRRRRDQGVREHQRHAARRHRADRPDPAGHHLPVADLLGDPVLHGPARRVLARAASATCSPRRG